MTRALVLGAGPAGCAAVYFLRKKGVTDITVVERSRIGGCSETRFYEGIPYEFGPQIMYADDPRIRGVFEEFLTMTPPPTPSKRYQPALSVNGGLSKRSIHSFPVTFANVLKLPNAMQVVDELYRVNLDRPDYSNFENYVISRMGKTLYETYVKNYNIKQWMIPPRDMDAEWARFRPMTLRQPGSGMFSGEWQGHPGDYNPMWSGMLDGVKLIAGTAEVSEDFQHVIVNGEPVDADLIVSTLPLSVHLDFINACLVYVSIKSDKVLMPSYATSFPNNYDFVRIMEYRQQYRVESEYTLLDFQFPWKDKYEPDRYIEQVRSFVKSRLKRRIVDTWVDNRHRVYPVSSARNLQLVERQLESASKSRVIPMGRCGVHAYVSKDTCVRMAMIMSENLDVFLSGDPARKKPVLAKMREKLA